MRLKLLVIGTLFPLPEDQGGAIRFMGLLRKLTTRHEVMAAFVRRPTTTEAEVDALSDELNIPVVTFNADGRRRRFGLHWIEAIARSTPPWVLLRESQDLHRYLQLQSAGYELALLMDEYAGLYASDLNIPVVVDKHNVSGWSGPELSKTASPLRRLHAWLGLRLIRKYERRYVHRVSSVVVTSPAEGVRLARLYGRRPDRIFPSAVDVPRWAPRVQRGSTTVGWLGHHAYEPNRDGLIRFVEQAWGLLGDAGFQLRIAGADPDERIKQLERYAGITIVGYIVDLAEFLRDIDVGVVPLWKGAGVKLKTLTLMAAGIPVVGTPIAFEGIEIVNGQNGFIGETPAALARILMDLSTDLDRAKRVGIAGMKLVERNYTWAKVGVEYASWLGSFDPPLP